MDALISVIIPTRNAGADIAECLASLQMQTFQNFDVHIVDAASMDDTLAKVESYKGKLGVGIFCWIEPESAVYEAMNIGIARSHGTWLYFLGADDILHDSAVFEAVAKHITAMDVDLIYGDAVFKNSGHVYGGEFSLERLLFERNICHQSIFYRRSVFERLGPFNPRYPIWADWDMNIRCFKHPGLCIQWVERRIAIYNDASGVSKYEDPVFKRELPVMLEQEYRRELDRQKSAPSCRIGKRLFGWIDKILC